jgi:hypothetical protein
VESVDEAGSEYENYIPETKVRLEISIAGTAKMMMQEQVVRK